MTTSMRSIGWVLMLMVWGCSAPPNAQQIIDRSIATHGGEKYQSATIDFDFRERHYRSERQGGTFTYYRIFEQDGKEVVDKLSNDNESGVTRLERSVNDTVVDLPDKKRQAFSNSVNSVHYFAQLPFGLNDPAVVKESLGQRTVKGQTYDAVRVTFRQEGGGVDFQDVFVYWIHPIRHTVDYLAYSYEVDGGGVRFREGINLREVNGILVQDYINFEGPVDIPQVEDLDALYSEGKLKELSRIILENVVVE